jgi:hypothetical protein
MLRRAVMAVLVMAASTLSILGTGTAAAAVPPPCENTQYYNKSYAYYGPPKWAPDAEVSHLKNIDFATPTAISGAVSSTHHWGISWSHDARIGYTGDVDAGGRIKIIDLAANVRTEIELKFHIDVIDKFETRTDHSASPILGPGEGVYFKAGSVIQTIQRTENYKDEFCNVGTNVDYFNMGGNAAYLTKDLGNFADPATGREAIGIQNLGWATINPPGCGSAAVASTSSATESISASSACMPGDADVEQAWYPPGAGGGGGGGGGGGTWPGSRNDLNRDGIADLLALYNDYTLAWYPGRGDGNFWSARTMGPAGFLQVVKADLNGDGLKDMLALYTDYTLAWYPGKGDGTFWSARILGPAGFKLMSLADLDGDAKADLLALYNDETLAWYPGKGDGTF